MSGDFRWLIEAPGARYLAVRKLSNRHDFHWTQNHNDALAFRTQGQAYDTMMAIRQMARMAKDELFSFEPSLGNALAVEHGWMDAPQGALNSSKDVQAALTASQQKDGTMADDDEQENGRCELRATSPIRFRCQDCRGTGTARVAKTAEGDWIDEPCPTCGGTGRAP